VHRHTTILDEGDMFLPKGELVAQRRSVKLLSIISGGTHKKREGTSTEAAAIRHLQEMISLRALPNAKSGR
jgi:hypothetical protein